MARLVTPAPDPVSQALRALSVRSAILCLSELREPWAFGVAGDEVAKFHVVLEGTAVLGRPGEVPIALAAGDVVVLPRGARHTLASSADVPARDLEAILAEQPLDAELVLRYGGDGRETRLLCGGFTLAEELPGSTLALLPEVVHVGRGEAGPHDALGPVLAALTAEAESGSPGASAVVAKIADVLLASVLRAWFANGRAVPPGTVGDPAVAKAVLELTSAVAEPWSLDRLARRVGLSRTALATRFRRATGSSPMRYLAAVRLDEAASYLSTGTLTTHEIARLTGYRDDASLSKAFKRRYGVPPGAYRRSAGALPRVETVALAPESA